MFFGQRDNLFGFGGDAHTGLNLIEAINHLLQAGGGNRSHTCPLERLRLTWKGLFHSPTFFRAACWRAATFPASKPSRL